MLGISPIHNPSHGRGKNIIKDLVFYRANPAGHKGTEKDAALGAQKRTSEGALPVPSERKCCNTATVVDSLQMCAVVVDSLQMSWLASYNCRRCQGSISEAL